MDDTEQELEAKLAAGGPEAVATFIELARSFYEQGGRTGLSAFVVGRFGAMKPADQQMIIISVLGSYFDTTKKTRH